YASIVHGRIRKAAGAAVSDQQAMLQGLLKTGARTAFGRQHNLKDVSDHAGYIEAVPIRDYEAFKPYIEQIKSGKENVLWSGKPIYFAKTSGTTSGDKYIPITMDSISNHIDTAIY